MSVSRLILALACLASVALLPALVSGGGEPTVEDLERIRARLDALVREAAALARDLEERGLEEEARVAREEADRLRLLRRETERRLEAARAVRDAPEPPGPGLPPEADPGANLPAPGDARPASGAGVERGGPARPNAPVALALGWLASHQDPQGFWDSDGFSARCRLNRCSGPGAARNDVGVTGLALLAFLGAGETHVDGDHRKVVRSGLRHLASIQGPEGLIGEAVDERFVYGHAIATLALAEAVERTGSTVLRRPAQRGADYIRRAQNPYLAWRYGVRPGDNDTSVTGWMVEALLAARRAGLQVDQAGLDGARAWIGKVTEPEFGRVGYRARGDTGSQRPPGLEERYPADRTEALTAIGVYVRVLTGEDPKKSELVAKGAETCARRPPLWDEALGSVDMYYWLWGSLALGQVGGDLRQRWQAALESALVDHQRRDGDEKGSWDPVGAWGREGGRIYSTAMCVLALETPWRRPPLSRSGPR